MYLRATMSLLENIDLEKTPKHVAVIMDGNGRWAKNQGKERIFGHFNGVDAVRECIRAARKSKVEFLTLYAFSTENWNRPKEEVDALMDLLVSTLISEIGELKENDIQLQTIGDTENLPEKCRNQLLKAIAETNKNKGLVLILALNYSAKWEIVEAMRKIASEQLPPSEINSTTIQTHLSTAKFPDPELLIRTSGEHRISNFLLWQIAYTEFHFTPVMWPDFKEEHFYQAILDFQNRERRFGRTTEQNIKELVK
jgi:undecaprenyl diphosphate synthase